MRHATRRLRAAVMIGALLWPAALLAQNDLAEVQVQMAEARRHFDGLEYEQAVPALDRAIAILGARRTEETRKTLADAYEMRARARFGLGDQNGAKEDFVNLLRTDPPRTLSGQISPRVITMFEEVQKATITGLKLSVVPPTAEVKIDGVPVNASTMVSVLVGDHTITATQLGYRPGSASITSVAGTAAEASLELARTSAVFTIVTAPSDVEIVIDGVTRGKTIKGPPPPDYAEKARAAGLPMADLSSVFTAADVPVGTHRVEFRKPCFVQAERRVEVAQLGDFAVAPVKLESAVATIVAQAVQAGTTVMVDGQDKGAAPYTTEVCEGEHIVELRTPLGRYTRRVDAKPGQRIEVSGAVKPAFALVSASTQGPLSADLRVVIERALEPVRSILVFAPPADRLDQTLKGSQLPNDWLAFDINKRPLGASADVSPPMRRELSTKIAKVFDAQGVASVTVPSNANRNRVVVALLGAGSAEPDVLELTLDRPETIADAVGQIDRSVSFLRPSIGLSTIDVADVPGPVVIGINAGGPGAQAGVQVGDVLLKVGDQAIAGGAALMAALASHKANDNLVVEMKDKAGAAKTVTLKVFMTPRLIGLSDQTLLANRMMVDLRARLASPADAVEESIIRLNLAAALARLQSWSDARTELQRVKLPDGPGVGNGTVQYLLGLAAESLGNRAEAEAAWKSAASSESWLTEDGLPVKELAEAKIAEAQRRPAGR